MADGNPNKGFYDLIEDSLRGRFKSTIYFVAITQTSLRRTSSTPPFGLSLNASYLALLKRPLKNAVVDAVRQKQLK